MPFSGYLQPEQIRELLDKAMDAELVTMDRALHLQGISRPFALSLPRFRNGSDLDQFQLDLIRLNETERLADGEVPLVQFLQNAAMNLRLRGRAEAEYFAQLGNSVCGVPKLPDPRQLREVRTSEAIIGLDEMVDFTYLAGGALAGRSVARLVVPRFEGGAPIKTARGAPWVMTGTGWLIAPSMIVTNWHVINCRRDDEEPAEKRKALESDLRHQASNTSAEFDYDSTASNITTVQVDSLLIFSEKLDYSLLRLKCDPGRAPLSLRSQRVVFTAATYLPVNIVQHPRGEPKRVAFRNNLVTGADEECVRYFTDTDFGSSGSPVCDDVWRVVALHRGSEFVRDVNYKGKSTAFVNYGTQIQAVLEDLQAREPQLYAEIAA